MGIGLPNLLRENLEELRYAPVNLLERPVPLANQFPNPQRRPNLVTSLFLLAEEPPVCLRIGSQLGC